MVSITLSRENFQITIRNVQSIRYAMRMEAIEIPIPMQADPLIMQVGGVSRHITIEWVEIGSESSIITTLANELMNGQMFQVFNITINEWGINKKAVVLNLDVTQSAGEKDVLRCRMEIIVGEAL